MAKSPADDAAKQLLVISNTLGGSLASMAARITDLVLPGLGTLAETLIQFPQKLLAAVTPFVEALNPALLLAFNTQLSNLQATVGTAFENIFNILAPVLDQVASLIQDVMTTLRPVIDSLASMFGGYLVEVTRNFVAEMKLLMPVLDTLMNILGVFLTLLELTFVPLRPIIEMLGLLLKVALLPLNTAMQTLQAVLKPVLALFDALSALAGAVVDVFSDLITTLFESLGLGDLLKTFADTVKDVTLALFTAIMKFVASLPFGWGDKILAGVEKRLAGTAHAVAAPKEVGFKGVEEIVKSMATAAFTAAGGKTDAEKQTSLQEQMLSVLREIRDKDKGAASTNGKPKPAGRWAASAAAKVTSAAAAALLGPLFG